MRASRVLLVLACLVSAGCLEAPAVPASAPGATAVGPPEITPLPSATPPPVPTPQPDPAPVASGPFVVHYVDVGQGDGTIWELPDGSIVLYDCGDAAPDAARNPMVAKLQALGKAEGSTIHALIASHGHLDHIGGCEEILANYRVLHLYEAWYDGDDAPASYTRFRDEIKREGGLIHTLRDTTSLADEVVLSQWEYLDLPASSGVAAQLLWPPTFATSDWEDIAQASLVVRVTHGENSFCFQGDIETAQEATLAEYSRDLSCDVALMGHHGSKHASSAAWLAKMAPTRVVASFGENSYGHPSSEALCRAQQAGAGLYLTHRLGDIALSSDRRSVRTSARMESTDFCAAGASYWGEAPAPAPTAATPAPNSPPSATPTPAAMPTPPTPSPTPTSPAPPSGPSAPFRVSASVSHASPCQFSTVTVFVHAVGANGEPVAGGSVTSSWHYKSTTSNEAGTTNANGDAALSRGISSASAGYTVVVDVGVALGDGSGSTSTSFTPVRC